MPRLYEAIAIFWKVVEITRRWARRIALESCQAVPNISGIADLAHLAIAHDIDACLRLVLHCLFDSPPHRIFKLFFIAGFSLVLREQ